MLNFQIFVHLWPLKVQVGNVKIQLWRLKIAGKKPLGILLKITNFDKWIDKHVKTNLTIIFWLSKIKISQKSAKKWTLEIFWTHFGVLYKKHSSEFMILAFHDYLLEQKITKCEDLLYHSKNLINWNFFDVPFHCEDRKNEDIFPEKAALNLLT